MKGRLGLLALHNDYITLNNLLHCIELTLKAWQNGRFVRLESLERIVICFQKPSNALWLPSHFVKKISFASIPKFGGSLNNLWFEPG